jgi:hypothetical protein
MAKREWTIWNNCQSEDGQYSWAIVSNMVCVRTQHGQKCTQVGGSPPDWIARVLAKELSALNKCEDC